MRILRFMKQIMNFEIRRKKEIGNRCGSVATHQTIAQYIIYDQVKHMNGSCDPSPLNLVTTNKCAIVLNVALIYMVYILMS